MKEVTYGAFALGSVGFLLMVWSAVLADQAYDYDCYDDDYLESNYGAKSSEELDLCQKDREEINRTSTFTKDFGYPMILLGLVFVIGSNKLEK